jgi:beta-lactamase superfamily II metal-dependent hydrolase
MSERLLSTTVGFGRYVPVVLLLATALTAGCTDTAGTDRSVETVEITVSTPAPTTPEPQPTRTVHFLALEEGASSLVVGERGSGIVVDTGSDPNATRVRRAMNRTGLEYYDLWLTGFNETRLGGAAALVRDRRPENIGFNGLTVQKSSYDAFLRAVVDVDRQRLLFDETASFSYFTASGSLQVLGPPSEYLAGGDHAQNELALAYESGETRVLWLGDPGRPEERWLLERSNHSLEADALVLAAGATPSSRLVEAVGPDSVVILGRAGANRTTEHLASTSSVEIHRPARDGRVTLRITEDGATMETGTRTPT